MRRLLPSSSARVAAAIVFTSAFTLAVPLRAQQAPTYSRTRPGAHDFRHRGDGRGFISPGRRDFANFYYDPYFYAPPVVAGYYYQRPYPYHFDYYRQRWGGPQTEYGNSGYPAGQDIAPGDCPCATPPTDSEE